MEIEYEKIVAKNLVLENPYLTRQNLELLLGKESRRTLDYRIAALIRDNVIEPIRPGFYINKKMYANEEDKAKFLEYIGNIMVYPSYVSLQYAMSFYGLIPEGVTAITYVTTKKPRKINSKGTNISFTYRNIKEDLFFDFDRRSYGDLDYFFAKRYKALFDLLYLTPLKDKAEINAFFQDARINWNVLTTEDYINFNNAAKITNSPKMKKIAKYLIKTGQK